VTTLTENYQNIEGKIQNALKRAGRPKNAAKLLVVSKGQSLEAIRELQALGQKDFGENYLQEWKQKKDQLPHLHWHFTGRLQTNKVKDLIGEMTLFHSIDRLKLAQAMDQGSEKRGILSRGFLEVDLAQEETKGGVLEKELGPLLEQLNPMKHLEIVGLMVLPPLSPDPEESRPYFKQLRKILFDLNRKSIYRSPLTELSMGMTNDYLVAIEEGATWVRIGRALFGER
jgi:pyridoxal phosphate enzyme (YggS family)